jgi:hypothetical protein
MPLPPPSSSPRILSHELSAIAAMFSQLSGQVARLADEQARLSALLPGAAAASNGHIVQQQEYARRF